MVVEFGVGDGVGVGVDDGSGVGDGEGDPTGVGDGELVGAGAGLERAPLLHPAIKTESSKAILSATDSFSSLS